MIGQYLPQTNKSATVSKSKIFSHLNKAFVEMSHCQPLLLEATHAVEICSYKIKNQLLKIGKKYFNYRQGSLDDLNLITFE